MSRKSGHRFSEKDMRKRKNLVLPRAIVSALLARASSKLENRRNPESGDDCGRTPVARTGTAAEGRGVGRGRFRPLHAWALFDRRVALPDHAARRGDAADDRRS